MKIYIIFAQEDAEYAKVLEAELRSVGHFILNKDLHVVESMDQIEESVHSSLLELSDEVIVLLSPAAIASRSVQQDLRTLTSSALHTSSVYIAMIRYAEIPLVLRNHQILNLDKVSPVQVANMLRDEIAITLRHKIPPPTPDWLVAQEGEPSALQESGVHAPEPFPIPGSTPLQDFDLPLTVPSPPAFAVPPPPSELAPQAPPTGTADDILKKDLALRVDDERSTLSSTDTLQFSAYHPDSLPVEEWQTLLVYSHVAAALTQVQADVGTFTELGNNPTTTTGMATRPIKQGIEMLIEPHMEGVTFTPASDSFIWRGDWHRSLFRCQGDANLAGKTQQGWIDIYAGGLVPIARVDVRFPFRRSGVKPMNSIPQGMTVTSSVYDRVFISYSHSDQEAFEQVCALYQQFGVQCYSDAHLAAGDDYERALASMIDAASVFHLLWSARSAASAECRKEWAQALQREPNERFIKPWFWKKPLVTPPVEFTEHHISFRYQHLKRKWWNPQTW